MIDFTAQVTAYTDSAAPGDLEGRPAYRVGCCVNCLKSYGQHYGWRCPDSGLPDMCFSYLPAGSRFETQEMRENRKVPCPIPVSEPNTTTIIHLRKEPLKEQEPDWKFFAKGLPDECACRRNRKGCPFHG